MKNSEEKILVSIIMPAYNVENYIEDSIKSVINQTYRLWELIIIDDGSTDSTAVICEKYVKIDYRISYIYQKNARQARARNNGISNSNGEILAFLDSDDLWLSEKLEISLLKFNLDKYDLLFANTYYSDDLNIDGSKLKSMHVIAKEYSGELGIKNFIERNKIPMLTVLVKKSAVINAGFFDESCVPAEDYDLWLRLLKKGYVFKALNVSLSIYRIHNESSSNNDRLVVDKVLNSFLKNFTSEEFENLNVKTYINFWIKRWVKIYLTDKNIGQLHIYMDYFKYSKFKFLFLVHKIIGLKNFKRLLLKLIK